MPAWIGRAKSASPNSAPPKRVSATYATAERKAESSAILRTVFMDTVPSLLFSATLHDTFLELGVGIAIICSFPYILQGQPLVN